MRSTNRPIMALLLALTLGVWGLLARSFFPPVTGSASPPPAATRVYFASANEADGKIFFDNSPGTVSFNTGGLRLVLNEAARRGIKVHSVVSPSNSGGYVVFVER